MVKWSAPLILVLGLVACDPALSGSGSDDDDITSNDDDLPYEDPCTEDAIGHTACQAEYGDMLFCADGECVEASGCEALDCCVPGPDGDEYCAAAFGDGSTCDIVGDPPDGSCSGG